MFASDTVWLVLEGRRIVSAWWHWKGGVSIHLSSLKNHSRGQHRPQLYISWDNSTLHSHYEHRNVQKHGNAQKHLETVQMFSKYTNQHSRISVLLLRTHTGSNACELETHPYVLAVRLIGAHE